MSSSSSNLASKGVMPTSPFVDQVSLDTFDAAAAVDRSGRLLEADLAAEAADPAAATVDSNGATADALSVPPAALGPQQPQTDQQQRRRRQAGQRQSKTDLARRPRVVGGAKRGLKTVAPLARAVRRRLVERDLFAMVNLLHSRNLLGKGGEFIVKLAAENEQYASNAAEVLRKSQTNDAARAEWETEKGLLEKEVLTLRKELRIAEASCAEEKASVIIRVAGWHKRWKDRQREWEAKAASFEEQLRGCRNAQEAWEARWDAREREWQAQAASFEEQLRDCRNREEQWETKWRARERRWDAQWDADEHKMQVRWSQGQELVAAGVKKHEEGWDKERRKYEEELAELRECHQTDPEQLGAWEEERRAWSKAQLLWAAEQRMWHARRHVRNAHSLHSEAGATPTARPLYARLYAPSVPPTP